MPSCDRLLDTPLASLTWKDLFARCRTCLTAREVAGLEREIRRLNEAGLPGTNAGDKTLHDVLRGEERPSFYDPEDSAKGISQVDESPARNTTPAETKPGPLPIPESVYFVYKDQSSGTGPAGHIPNATAFVLSVPDKGHRSVIRFLVTARHVVDPQWAHCPAKNPQAIEIRLNKWSGGVGYETIPLESKHLRSYFTPADDQSDIAIIYLDRHLIPNLENYKFIDLPYRMLPTEVELLALRADLQVMTAGLSLSSPIGERSYPAFRSGVLSNLNHDPIDIQCSSAADPKSIHLWFLSATISRGVSGAPVYASIDRFDAAAQLPVRAPVLLGIQSMAWPNQGLAGMTPSGALRELVQSTLANRHLDMDLYRGPG